LEAKRLKKGPASPSASHEAEGVPASQSHLIVETFSKFMRWMHEVPDGNETRELKRHPYS